MSTILNGKKANIKVSKPILTVDNQARNRSGHMGHALADLGNGHVIAFNGNTSPLRFLGHSGFGWVEYRYSEDYGKTFGEIHNLPYSIQAFIDGKFNIAAEKAVVCDDGTLVLFCLRNTTLTEICCCPWLTPTYVRSKDGGETWEDAKELCEYGGRIYDAVYRDGSIYVLEFCNDAAVTFTGNKPEDVYRIYKSDDNGETFYEHAVVPFPDTIGRAYGAMQFDDDDNLFVYAYNEKDEVNMDYAVSKDGGKTWDEIGKSFLAKKIRNPQVGLLDGQFICHGRTGMDNQFVIYTSANGKEWDEGTLTTTLHPGISYYSNNLVFTENGKQKMLVQYSETYRDHCVNIYHQFLETE